MKIDARLGIALIVLCTAIIAGTVFITINVGQEQTVIRMRFLQRTVHNDTASCTIGFRDAVGIVPASVQLKVEKIAPLNRTEATSVIVYNQTRNITIQPTVHVEHWKNITTLSPHWNYRVEAICTVKQSGEVLQDEFYIFDEE